MPRGIIIEITRAYHANLIEGALLAGILSEDDLDAVMPEILTMAQDVQLTYELHRRVAARGGVLRRSELASA